MAAPITSNMKSKFIQLFRGTRNIFYNTLKRYSSSQPDLVEVSKQNKLHLIGINRPEKRNCVNIETARQLKKAFLDFEEDANAYIAVLYGKGGNFCAGYDLQVVANCDTEGISLEDGPMGPTRMFSKKPVIAAVSGYAVAGGLELALWCDMRIVEDSAVMGVFCRRFGVPLLDGGTVRLPRLIGLSRALDLILTGRGVKASEALEMGLANKVVPSGTALSSAVDIANSLCEFPQDCLNADRYSAYHAAYSQSLDEALKFELENSCHILAKESVKGAQKFVQGFGRHGRFLSASDSKEGVNNVSKL